MVDSNKLALLGCFRNAKLYGSKYVGVLVETKGSEKPEVIINPKENFEAKEAYYDKAYDDDLVLKTFAGIKIVGFEHGNTFEQLECSLLHNGCIR